MSQTETESAAPVAQGAVLAGKYKVERVIGEGGMGVVVEAKHIALDERVAMKFLTAAYATHPEAAARFLREARAAVKIKSEHVARVSDVGTLETGAPYMVMELLQGNDLNQELQSKGVLPMQDAVDYVIQACEAIAEAHAAGIVHRDLKPANLFLTRRMDGSALVKVLDFGISKMSDGVENLTKTMAAMGSALYMSPEQMQQTRGVDHRTDIYALGVALYELLAGKQPYYADTLPQLCAEVLTGTPTPLRTARPDVPPGLAAVIEKAYARDRADRYGSVAHFVVALAPFAPPRSQPNIDRIARAAGLPIPIAGAPAPVPVPAGGPLLAGGGTIAMDASPLGQQAQGAPGRPSGAPAPADAAWQNTGPAQAAPHVGSPGQQFSSGSGPQVFQPGQGSTSSPPGPAMAPPTVASPGIGSPATAPNMEVAAPARPVGSKAPLFIGIGIALVLAGAGGFFATRLTSAPAPASAGPATAGSSGEVTSGAATPPPSAATAASAAASGDPAPGASGAAGATPATTSTATASGEPAASAKPATATAPAGGRPGTGASTGAKPTATTKPKSIFDDR